MSQDMKTGSRRPIGYWLKHLDRLIEDTFSRTLAGQGLTRRHWQVLNTLAQGPARPADLSKALQPDRLTGRLQKFSVLLDTASK